MELKCHLIHLLKKLLNCKIPLLRGLTQVLKKFRNLLKKTLIKEYGAGLDGVAAALFNFNKGLIDALFDIVPAVKPQCAYYEKYGWQGMRALSETIAYAKSKGMFVITDGKRNDIGSTMEAYAARISAALI